MWHTAAGLVEAARVGAADDAAVVVVVVVVDAFVTHAAYPSPPRVEATILRVVMPVNVGVVVVPLLLVGVAMGVVRARLCKALTTRACTPPSWPPSGISGIVGARKTARWAAPLNLASILFVTRVRS